MIRIQILGVKNNIKFLQTLIKHPKVVEWDFDTNFIAKNDTDLINLPIYTTNDDILATVICRIMNHQQNYYKSHNNQNPWFKLDNFRVNYESTNSFKLFNPDNIEGNNKPNKNDIISVDLKYQNENTFALKINNKGEKISFQSVTAKFFGENQIEIKILNDKIFRVHVFNLIFLINFLTLLQYYATEDNNIVLLKKDGSNSILVYLYIHISYYHFQEFVKDDYELDSAVDSNPLVKAPIASKVKDVFVKVGDVLDKGDRLLSVISMKMEVYISSLF